MTYFVIVYHSVSLSSLYFHTCIFAISHRAWVCNKDISLLCYQKCALFLSPCIKVITSNVYMKGELVLEGAKCPQIYFFLLPDAKIKAPCQTPSVCKSDTLMRSHINVMSCMWEVSNHTYIIDLTVRAWYIYKYNSYCLLYDVKAPWVERLLKKGVGDVVSQFVRPTWSDSDWLPTPLTRYVNGNACRLSVFLSHVTSPSFNNGLFQKCGEGGRGTKSGSIPNLSCSPEISEKLLAKCPNRSLIQSRIGQ